MNKDVILRFRVTKDELTLIDKKVEASQLNNRSKYLRKMAMQGYIVIKDYKEVEQLIYEVNKIGNNINQIARKANEFEYLNKDDLKSLREKLDGIYNMIGKFYDE